MPSVFDSLGAPPARRVGGSVFDALPQEEPEKEPGIFDRLVGGVKETIEALPAVPGQAMRLGGAAAQSFGMGGAPGSLAAARLASTVQDIQAADQGDREAAKRLKANQIIASTIASAPFPMGATIASQAGFNALGGAAGAGAEAASSGQPILPAMTQGAFWSGILGPILGTPGRMAAKGATPASLRAIVAADPALTEIARRDPALAARIASREAGAIYQAPTPGRTLDLDAQVSAAQAVDEARLQGMSTYAQEVRGVAGRQAPEPHPVDAGTAPPLGAEVRVDPEALRTAPDLRGPIPTPKEVQTSFPTPAVDENGQWDFFGAPRPPLTETPKAFKPSGNPLGIERFPNFKASEQPGAMGQLKPSEAAAVAANPEMVNAQRGLFGSLREHPGLKSREQRLAFASSAVGREVKSFNDLTLAERGVLKKQLEGMRKMASNVPEAKMLQRADDLLDVAPPGRFAAAAEVYHRAITAVSSRFRSWGPAGQRIADKMEVASTAADRRVAMDELELKRVMTGLSLKQRVQVGDVMQGAPTADPKVRLAADRMSQILSEYADEAERLALPTMNPATGQISVFTRMKNYFPQIHTEDSIRRWAKPHEIESARRQLRSLPKKFRGGGIQFSRVADIPGWERDPLRALPLYFRRSAKRLADAREFGSADSEALSMIQEIARTHGRDAGTRAQALFTAYASPLRRELAGIMQPIRNAAVVGMLTTTGLVQPGQLANTIAREGFLNTLKAMRGLMTSPAKREWAEKTGAAVGSILNDISPDGASIASNWSKWIGLTFADRANRLTSALAARLRAEQVAEALRAGRHTPAVIADAKRLGIPLTGEINEELLSLAGQRGANSTQFAGRFQDLPEWRDNELGRTVYLFRSFALQQGRFVKDMVNDARRGNWAPLLRYAAATAAIGIPLGEGIRKLKGNEAPDDPAWRVLEDMAYVSSLGMFQDVVRAAAKGEDAMKDFALGPVLSEATQLGGELGQAVQGEPERLQEHFLRRTVGRIPLVGRELQEQYAP